MRSTASKLTMARYRVAARARVRAALPVIRVRHSPMPPRQSGEWGANFPCARARSGAATTVDGADARNVHPPPRRATKPLLHFCDVRVGCAFQPIATKSRTSRHFGSGRVEDRRGNLGIRQRRYPRWFACRRDPNAAARLRAVFRGRAGPAKSCGNRAFPAR